MRVGWAVCGAAALWAEAASGASVLTPDGRTHTGKVEFRAGNVVLTPAAGEAITWPLQGIARIIMADPVPAAGKPVDRDPRLPLPWQQADVGRVKEPGNGREENGVFTVRGAGWGIWGEADSFHFVHQRCVGDVDVAVRLGALPTEEEPFVAGLTFRESLDAGAAQASVMLFPGGVVRMSCRPVSGTVEAAPAAGNRPYEWVRLARTGDRFSGFASRDGKTWVLAGTVKVRMNSAACVGLACATTLNQAALGTTFDHFTLAARTMGPAEGFGLVDGSLVAGRVKWMDEQSLQYVDSTGAERKLPADAVANLFTRSLPSDVRHALTSGAPGVSLTTGDEIEGAVQSVRDGGVNVSSLLFGRQSTPLAQVVTAVLRPTKTRRASSVAVRDGSVYQCLRVTVGDGVVVAETGTLGTLNLKPDEIAEIELSP